jgi:integrase
VDALDREQIRCLIRQVRVPRLRLDTKRGRAHGGIEAARRALGVLRLMVGWAIEERLLNREDNPASRMERHLPKKRKADRVLSIDEVGAVWRTADSGFASDNHARLMLLTGCRAGEWARARWPWVNLKQGLLSIPASQYKPTDRTSYPSCRRRWRSWKIVSRAGRATTCCRRRRARSRFEGWPSFIRRACRARS